MTSRQSVTSPVRRVARVGVLVLALAGVLASACNSGRADPAGDALARGVAAQNAAKPEDAKKAYYETLAQDPANKLAFYNLGQIARVANKPQIAEGYYRSVLEIDGSYAPAVFGLAYVRAQQDAVADAIVLYRRTITLDPNFAAAHYNLGLLLRVTGAVAEGDAEIARGRQLDPALGAPAAAPVQPASPSPTPSGSPRR
ncbi:MAG TPA: tetratricopeptide repeat protein [Candidatus Limnocylindria bacterium]|nr:tetratricopeptide repeat protein [Candidatus Limnocylindria bacterium]